MTSNIVQELDIVQQFQQGSFSRWPYSIPSAAQMIEAGFFNCNVGDRVICIYCNLICQRWTPHTDDPWEVHKILSPNCVYVKTKLTRPGPGSLLIVNETAAGSASCGDSLASNNLDQFRCNEFVHTAACNPAYAELPKRTASYATGWPDDNLPAVDDLVRAGFFYTGTKTIVTCFYCNGSLQNWGPKDNPTIEHARWFPHCAYAKQLCGDQLYRKIQESKRAQQERVRANESKEKLGSTNLSSGNTISSSRQLLIPDESTLSRLVAARLDLPISQRLLDKNFKLSIITRCWEDQLRLKQEDFATDFDLYMACLILQRQIKHIDGKLENIVVPNVWMTKWKENQRIQHLVNFVENEITTIQREQSFTLWPYLSPSQFDMVISGWFRIATASGDATVCFHCGVRYDNWDVNIDPYLIHRQLSPSCPFIHSLYPIQPNSILTKLVREAFTQQRIITDANQPTSNIILTSNALNSGLCDRANSFHDFPGGYPINIDALIKSGFYYTGISTLIRCYECRYTVNNFHLYPSNDINNEHLRRSPLCRFAKLLVNDHRTMPYNASNLCKWCWKKPIKFVIDPCMHFAICDSCIALMHTCPICGTKAQNFIKVFS